MIRTRLFVLGAGLVLAAAAFAHSTLKSTVPASGSVLAASPEEIVLEFNEPAVVTSVVVIDAGQVERKLAFAPSGSAATFTITAPALTAGRNEIRWAALSGDGHPVTGTLILVIKPSIAHDADHRDD
ncbi:MAG TPA: copper resistance CopC family protein [Pseudomonadales bacterium]|nr:copper resistance CopC family protein [Pseudomonadales bacterium]